MEVTASPTYLISIIATSTVLAATLAAALGIIGQIVLEKLKHKYKKEERNEDKIQREDVAVADSIEVIINRIGNLTTGLRGLYYDRILYLSNRYIEEGDITSKELSDLDELHDIYKKRLDGDGFLDKEMDKVHNLPRVKAKPCSKEKLELLLREIMGIKKSVEKKPDESGA